MTTIAYCPVNIQTSVQSVPSIPTWFGEMTLLAHHLTRQKILESISKQVRFARRRFGRYEVIDFVCQAPSSSLICSLALWPTKNCQGGCGTGKQTISWSLMWTVP